MIPVKCRISHDPTNGAYGDCMRACIASILEMQAEVVPHFGDGNPTPEQFMSAINAFLNPLGKSLFRTVASGTETLEDVLQYMGEMNPDLHYILGGAAEGGNHVVVCCGSAIVHDPSWYPSRLTGPADGDFWHICIIAVR